MAESRDELTERQREIEALCAMLEFSKARALELDLEALSYSLESAIKIAKAQLPSTSVIWTSAWDGSD